MLVREPLGTWKSWNQGYLLVSQGEVGGDLELEVRDSPGKSYVFSLTSYNLGH